VRQASCRDIGLLRPKIQLPPGDEKGPGFPGPFPLPQRLALRLVLLAAHILLAGIFVLLTGLATLLALLLARLLTRLGLVLPLLLLTRLSRLAALTALVVGHSRKSSWMGFSQPEG
jgi:hypothetical protein